MCGHSGTITISTGKHDHCICQHELVFCSVCNVVYCKKCGKEWHQDNYIPYTITHPILYHPSSGT